MTLQQYRNQAELEKIPKPFSSQERLDVILQGGKAVSEAISTLFRRDKVLEDVCGDIQRTFRFDFVSVQLIRFDEDVIEAAHGVGPAAAWAGRSKHYLENDPTLRDIQADIVKTHTTEIIAGPDQRFDPWIYREYKHDRFVRIFAPILLMYDDRGKVVENWHEECRWEPTPEDQTQGQHAVLKMRLPMPPDHQERSLSVIGTIEAGYDDPQRRIEAGEAIILNGLVARRALDIRRVMLPAVLETIAESAMRIVGADATSLHFLWRPEADRYAYEINSGLSTAFLKAGRPDALGENAIRHGRPALVPDPDQDHDDLAVQQLNPNAFAKGIRAIAALPLVVGDARGVLYLYFYRPHRFNDDELAWAQLLATRATDAIRQVTTHDRTRYVTRQLVMLHAAAQSLARASQDENLLDRIAANAANFLGADVVTVYEYRELDREFRIPASVAGWLRNKQHIYDEMGESSIPFLVVQHDDNIYAHRLADHPLLGHSDFATIEKIVSTAAVLLKIAQEVVGVLFVDYRRLHAFSDEERQLIETLASSAALAIKNRRWMQTRSELDREIISTLEQDKLLNLIAQRAVQTTRADRGEIRLLDPITDELVTKASYGPSNDGCYQRMEETLGRWVADWRTSTVIEDVLSDVRTAAGTQAPGAALSVPLVEREKRVIGVLTVTSHYPQAFDQQHLQMVEALANQAVIAIQNVKTNEHRLAAERIATLGDFAGTLVHDLREDCGAILMRARRIFNEGDAISKENASQIIARIETVRARAEDNLKSWSNEKPEPVDLRQVVTSALADSTVPVEISTRTDLPPDMPFVTATAQILKEVLQILIKNAKEAMPNRGTLTIVGERLERRGEVWARIAVCDTGSGIPENDQEKVFQRGFSTKGRSRGFGLHWARLYIERLDGRLTVESRPREGARFTIALPAPAGRHEQASGDSGGGKTWP